MRIDKQLSRWHEAGLIDVETVDRIKNYEASHQRPLLLYAISGIGALSLCLGLISLVASNWHQLSSSLKLCLDLLIGAGLCGYLAKEHERLSKWVKELLIALISGWTLASIALIGQVYQLSGDGKSAITFWTALTVPLILQGRSTLSGVLLLGMLSATCGLWFVYLKSTLLILSIPGLVLAAFALSIYEPAYRRRPEILNVFRYVGLTQIVATATASSFIFYKSNHLSERELNHLFKATLFCLPSLAWLWVLLGKFPKSCRAALVASVLCVLVPLCPHQGNLGFLAILFFISYWSVIAKASLDVGFIWLFRLATFAIAVRLVSMYFELVGSLLDTGLLFLSGGALILFVARFWYQKQAELIMEYQQGGVPIVEEAGEGEVSDA